MQGTAEELWDVSSTILACGYATGEDWEMARLSARHLLAALERRFPLHVVDRRQITTSGGMLPRNDSVQQKGTA
jgi:hypothetical protein